MRIGLYVFAINAIATPEFLETYAICAEERGFSTLWFPEHVVTFDEYRSDHPYSAESNMGLPHGVGFLEPLSTMSFVAARTERIRLATGIAILPQRQPLYTAKELANIDWLSGGRVDCGIGLGWSREEYEACQVPWQRRGARCDEYIRLLRTCWDDELSAFSGEFYALPPARFFPKPVQAHLPIHLGGESDAALRRTARYGDGWHGMGLSPRDTADRLAQLGAALAAESRELSEITVTISPHIPATPPPTAQDIAEYAAAGVDEVVVWCTAARAEDVPAALDEIAGTYLQL